MPRPSSSTRRRRRSRSSTQARRGGWLVSTFKWLAIGGVSLGILGAIGAGYVYSRISADLPDVDVLREVQLQIPLRVYTAEGDLIAEFGEKRREPVMISEVPDSLRYAIIASEDARFYEHPGVDWQGIARAAAHLIRTGRKGPGGSTITMQVARNFFLSNERTYNRKLVEIVLALEIERKLSKDEILELYLNKIYLGNRSYGFAAASKVYYGKPIGELALTESAMLAGLPKAPSRYNPIVNPERALIRRDYVLRRMNETGHIDDATLAAALATPDDATLHHSRPDAEAPYVGEMARARVQQLFGDVWSTGGYDVYTSIRSADQRAANAALRDALYDYESRHGWRGPVTTFAPELLEDPVALVEALDEVPRPGDLEPAVVVASDAASATLITRLGGEHVLGLADVEWARERLGTDERGEEITAVDQVLVPGAVVHLQINADGTARFVQEPGVEAAFVAMAPDDGRILALAGGYDFYRSKFNRATQARRQPGSTFKPFIYSAALAAGDTAATVYNDAPVVFHDDALEGEWRPSNYSGRFFGPTRLREALVKSRNLVSIRVLREIGIPYARDYALRFGFAPDDLPKDLSLALGSAAVTPIELAGAFSVFANGGHRVPPHFIDRIVGPRGDVVYSTPRVVPCDDCRPDEDDPLVEEMAAETASDDRLDRPAATTDDSIVADGQDGPTVNEEGLTAEAEARLAEVRRDVVDAPRVIDARNAWLMDSMLREVVRRGTGRRAGEALGRADLAGKTGTTNDQLDAWFAGYNDSVAAVAWIGSDGLDPLGRGEAGGVTALPMWTSFMQATVAGTPVPERLPPEGMTAVRVDRSTGEPSTGEGAMVEWFVDETLPEELRPVAIGEQLVVPGPGNTGNSVRTMAVPEPKTGRERAREVEQLF